MEKLCAKCEVSFSCGSEESICWCKQVDLSAYTLKYLETNFKGCLCPACLQPFAIVDMDAELEEDEEEEGFY